MPDLSSKIRRFIFIAVLLLAGCQSGAVTPQPSDPVPTQAATEVVLEPTDTPQPTVSPTAAPSETPEPAAFDGERAYQDVVFQESLGPRLPESEAHNQVVQWIQEELASSGWEVELQEVDWQGHRVRNVIGKRGEGSTPWVIVGAHFDSRMYADRDPDPTKQTEPVPGANDGGSGVAVLLELARTLPDDLDKQVWLAFFDLEDQGNIAGWDWILGSSAMADSVGKMDPRPDAVVVVDMIGDASLNLPIEQNSSPELVQELWGTAAELGYGDYFLNQPGYSIFDDHTPFLNQGIPAVDIIDFDYQYWHTTGDTADKVSANSLKVVGDTVLAWLLK